MLPKKAKKILEYFSTNEVELSARPFKKAASDLNTKESELIELLLRLQTEGVLKSLRGAINHRRAGYPHNALIAWRNSSRAKLAEGKLIKEAFLADDRISHCYKRKAQKSFNYGIFTMMHARTKQEIDKFVCKTARCYGLDYEVLFTEKELKKEKLKLSGLL